MSPDTLRDTMPSNVLGEIITFYSYKGGVGRSMALSNVACLLARRGDEKKVLMIDWDLEAPGLHKFFYDKFQISDHAQALAEKPGLIDLFLKLDTATPESRPVSEEEAEKIAYKTLESIELEQFIVKTDIPNLSLLKAGRLDADYSNRVNSFKWEKLYYRSPLLIRLLAERLAEQYSYVLIDSRTGYTDISG
ncbi:MAG: AAA family ATPase, partial [Candidatus Methanoperedens sp.]|nr:AAA family ATPase [Candidatus Methanoperedens sp.]